MEDFTQELVEILKGMASPEIRVNLVEVTKVNDQISKAICLLRPEPDVSRNIFPEEYFWEYQRGISMEKIAEKILKVFQEEAQRVELEMKLGIFNPSDFGRTKRRIYGRLINFDRSTKYLEDKCYIRWLDLAICFFVTTESREGQCTIINVTEDLRHTWGVSKQEVLAAALENLCNDCPAQIVALSSLIEKYADLAENKDCVSGDTNPPESPKKELFYVLTNTMRFDSAVTILYPNVLKDFADEMGVEEVVILPSSTNETLLVPQYKGMELDAGWCRETIENVNESHVMPEEILSSHAYIYRRKSGEIKIFE